MNSPLRRRLNGLPNAISVYTAELLVPRRPSRSPPRPSCAWFFSRSLLLFSLILLSLGSLFGYLSPCHRGVFVRIHPGNSMARLLFWIRVQQWNVPFFRWNESNEASPDPLFWLFESVCIRTKPEADGIRIRHNGSGHVPLRPWPRPALPLYPATLEFLDTGCHALAELSSRVLNQQRPESDDFFVDLPAAHSSHHHSSCSLALWAPLSRARLLFALVLP